MDRNPNKHVPSVLYKYRNLTGDGRDHVRQTIVENKVWFASRKDFNDPFDCRVHAPRQPEWARKKEYMDALKEHRLELNRAQRRDRVISCIKKERRHENPSREMLDHLQRYVDSLGVFCLSARNDDILMWSYYAHCHTGLCLGFLHRDGRLGPALPVDYVSEFPQLSYTDNKRRQMEANLLTKAEAWKHEAEWRIIDDVDGPGLKTFPHELLSEVILGARMPLEDREEVISWISARGRERQPKLYEALIKERVYGLEIRPFELS